VPTYRIFYTERESTEDDRALFQGGRLGGLGIQRQEPYAETEWEEEVEGGDGPAALSAFFREHATDSSQIMSIDEEGNSRPLDSSAAYAPDQAYIWIENDKLMEYQGLEEATPGLVSCPLCDGAGEVTAEVADEYLATVGEEVVEEEGQ
jgi:hypothetical protein